MSNTGRTSGEIAAVCSWEVTWEVNIVSQQFC